VLVEKKKRMSREPSFFPPETTGKIAALVVNGHGFISGASLNLHVEGLSMAAFWAGNWKHDPENTVINKEGS
jgi:phage/plasmid primase-like uncharacterized protein